MDESTCVKLLEQHGIRPTSNRIIVVRALAAEPYPISAAELEGHILTIDKSGIFRSLMLFREHHLVHVIEDGEGGVKYELCHSHAEDEDDDRHVHFYCEKCRRLLCLHDVPVPHVKVPGGHIAHSVSYTIKGVCANCMKENPSWGEAAKDGHT